jgi:hypothetical protein
VHDYAALLERQAEALQYRDRGMTADGTRFAEKPHKEQWIFILGRAPRFIALAFWEIVVLGTQLQK